MRVRICWPYNRVRTWQEWFVVYKNHYGFTTHFQEFVRPCASRWGSAGDSTQTENQDSPPWGLGPMVWVQEPHFFWWTPVNPQVVSEIMKPTKKLKKPLGGHHSQNAWVILDFRCGFRGGSNRGLKNEGPDMLTPYFFMRPHIFFLK